jgi:hypothetical protein
MLRTNVHLECKIGVLRLTQLPCEHTTLMVVMAITDRILQPLPKHNVANVQPRQQVSEDALHA